MGSAAEPQSSPSWEPGNPLTRAGRPQLRDRTTGDRDRDLLSGFRAAQDLADLVAQLFLGDRRHPDKVAILLPWLKPIAPVAGDDH